MIQFNKTIFQFTKRLAIVLVSMFICNTVIAGGGGGKAVYYTYIAANVEIEGVSTLPDNFSAEGKVYVGITSDTPSSYNQAECSILTTGNESTHTYYLHANTSVDGYLFDDWYDGTTPLKTKGMYQYDVSPSQTAEPNVSGLGWLSFLWKWFNNQDQDPKDYKVPDNAVPSKTFTAKWKVPQVTGVKYNNIAYSDRATIDVTESISDPNKEHIVKINFDIKQANKSENFNLYISDDDILEPNELVEWEDISDVYGGTYIEIPISFSPTSHGVTLTKYVKLESNYKGAEASPTSIMVKITIGQDYTPRFEVEEESITLVIGNDGTANSKDQGFNIIPVYLNTVAREYATWTVTLEGDGFTKAIPEGGKEYNPIISFTKPESEARVFNGTLTMTCTYEGLSTEGTNKEGEVKSPIVTTKIVHLVATSNPVVKFGTTSESNLSALLNAISGAEPATTGKYSFTSNISISSNNWVDGGSGMTYQPNPLTMDDKEVTITIPTTTLPGVYMATLTASGSGMEYTDADEDGTFEGNEVTKTATLAIEATVKLAKPILEAYPENKKVELRWQGLYGATHYVVVSSEVADDDLNNFKDKQFSTLSFSNQIVDIETKIEGATVRGEFSCYNNYTDENMTTELSNDSPYHYYLIAFYVKDGVVVDCAISDKVTAIPSNYPLIIDESNASNIGLQTGTEGTTNDDAEFPYKKVRNIDVTAAFYKYKEGDWEACFDRLYLFGLTTCPEGKNLSSTTANTPCYIYEKTENKKAYEHKKTIPNINNSKEKDGYFKIIATGQSIYLTGYCPYTSTGASLKKDDNTTAVVENGVIEITGETNSSIDIYLDNLQLFALSKPTSALTLGSIDMGLALKAKTGYFYPIGSGSIFSLSSTSSISAAPFKPTIHISNNNQLDASFGSKVGISRTDRETKVDVRIAADTQYSSPIQIRPITDAESNEQYTSLTIDDIWPYGYIVENEDVMQNNRSTIRTNGTLVLTEVNESSNLAPSIDLGNEYSVFIINGGQVSMNCKADDLHISMRSKTLSYTNQFESSENLTYNFRGYGSADPTKGGVRINDGTLNANEGTLLCPTNTTIDGGSFNCVIRANGSTDIKNAKGKPVHRVAGNIVNGIGEVTTNGLVKFDAELDGKDGFDVLMDNIFPHANCQSTIEGQNYYTSLSYYYPEVTNYGHSSLAPQGTTVYLMLPKDGSVSGTNYKGWSFCAPHMQGTADIGGKTFVTDNVEIISTAKDKVLVSEANDKLKVTNRLLFIELDAISESVLNESGSITIEDAPYEVTNPDVYTINEKTYMLLPVVAGQWRMVVPPFDVHNVYVIESYPEDQLKKDYGEQIRAGRWRIEGEEAVTNARKAQSNRLLDLLAYWLAVENLDTDFFGASAGTYSAFVNEWINYEQKRDKDGKSPDSDANYTPMVEQLFHYTGDDGAYPDGKGWWNANYYLYKSNGVWTGYDSATNMFETDWEIVTTQSTERGSGTPNVIMQRGGLYTMQFPAVVGTTATDWNYWTGKYILLEGYGPQTIYGKNGANAIGPSASNAGQDALVFGNASFANIQKEGDHLFNVVEKTNDEYNTVYDFERAKDENGNNITVTIKPTEGFLFTDLDATTSTVNEEGQTVQTMKLARTISSETGEVQYEVKTNIIDNNPGLGSGIPTIMGDLSLMVVPTAEGLTITPLKEQHVMLFDAEGKMIFSKYMSEEENVSLPTGVYVVRGEYEQVKAIKK